jgi:hypothetical protein
MNVISEGLNVLSEELGLNVLSEGLIFSLKG